MRHWISSNSLGISLLTLMACAGGKADPVDDTGLYGGVDEDSGDTDDGPCISETTVEVIDAHVQALTVSGHLLAGHGGERESVSMLLLPGYECVAAQYASMIEACSAPLEYDPWCDGVLCWQLGCPADDASNQTRGWIDRTPFDNAGFVFDSGEVTTTWNASTDLVGWTLSSVATGPDGIDYSVEGEGTLDDAAAMTLTETYPGLVDGGANLEAAFDPSTETITGQFVAGGVNIAAFNALGHLEATGDCP